tara:strand:- start:40 stop:156 length:117 start_codon:yes stop_codon:yes gene_type:complete
VFVWDIGILPQVIHWQISGLVTSKLVTPEQVRAAGLQA